MSRLRRRRWILAVVIVVAVIFLGWTQWAWRFWPRVESFPAWPQSTSEQRFATVFDATPVSPSPLDEALQRPLETLLDKTHLAPSGDARDYTSLSIYWWPNPLTTLPWLPHDGQRNPAAADYDAPRLHKMVSTVRTLAAANKAEADARALQWLRAWFITPTTRMNPHLTYAQMMPGIAAGGRQGIIEGLPLCLELLDALAWLDARGTIPTAERRALRQWFGSYLAWLMQSRAGRAESARPNNHGTWSDVQICALALSLGDAALAKTTLHRAPSRLSSQFAADGSQPEELRRADSLAYSIYNLDAWLRLAQMETSLGLARLSSPKAEGKQIEQGIAYLERYRTGKANAADPASTSRITRLRNTWEDIVAKRAENAPSQSMTR